MWHEIKSFNMPDAQLQSRAWVGWAALIAIVGDFLWLAYREVPAIARTAQRAV